MRDYLAPFEAGIPAFAETEHDILEQGSLLWSIIHYVILHYQENNIRIGFSYVMKTFRLILYIMLNIFARN
jgi:hypothetical protein